MGLPEMYEKVKPSIVAIVARASRNPDFPDIIGTGFIGHADGIIFINDHVIKAINKIPRRKNMGPNEWPVGVVKLTSTEAGMATLNMEVRAAITVELTQKPSYGSQNPDVGIIRVPYRNL